MFTFGGFKRGSNLLGRIFLALQEPKVLWQSQILDVQIITGRESLWCCLAMTHDQVKLILAKSIKTCKCFGAGKLLDFRIMPQHRRSYAIWMSRVQRWRDWRCFFTPLYMLCWNVNKYTHTWDFTPTGVHWTKQIHTLMGLSITICKYQCLNILEYSVQSILK